jgi:hypothetical protein
MSAKARFDRALAVAGAAGLLCIAGCGGTSGSLKQADASRTTSTTTTQQSEASSSITRRRSSPTTQVSTTSTAATSAAGSRIHREMAAYVECLRSGGVRMPPARVSVHGDAIHAPKVDTQSPQFRHARAVCLPKVEAAFRSGAR